LLLAQLRTVWNASNIFSIHICPFVIKRFWLSYVYYVFLIKVEPGLWIRAVTLLKSLKFLFIYCIFNKELCYSKISLSFIDIY
jgi:intergrase/recombinase